MKTNELTSVEERSSGFTHMFKVFAVTDVNAAATTQTINLLTNVALGDYVTAAAFYLKVPFTGGAGTNTLLEVGDVADADGFLAGSEVNSAGTEILAGDGDGAYFATLRTGKAYVGAETITCLFTNTGANLSTLTAGEVWIFIRLIRMAKLG
jgi:hypothetical protein